MFTFGPPAFSSRLSVPVGHLPHQTVLSRDAESLLTVQAVRCGSPLAHHRGVVVIRGHLATGHLVGVAGGAALAQGVGLLILQQIWAPVVQQEENATCLYAVGFWVCFFYVTHSLWCFSPEEVIHHIWIGLQQTHQNLVLQVRRHLKKSSKTVRNSAENQITYWSILENLWILYFDPIQTLKKHMPHEK